MMKQLYTNFFDSITKLIFDSHCVFCKAKVQDFNQACSSCYKKFDFKGINSCPLCGDRLNYEVFSKKCLKCEQTKPPFTKLIHSVYYNDIAALTISLIKYKDKDNFLQLVSLFMINSLRMEENLDFDIIVPVPVSFKTFLKRKYNQCSFLAQSIGKEFGKKCFLHALRKSNRAKAQASLNKHQRIQNVKNNFFLKEKYKKSIRGKKVLLVDDIFTTGSTAKYIANLLKKAGAKEVIITVFAKVDKTGYKNL